MPKIHGSSTLGLPPVGVATNLRIGRRGSTSGYLWDGAIDNVVIYDRPLTPSEIARHAQAVTFELSADGGLSWCDATPGVAVDFTTCNGDVRGNDLRWRANLSTPDSLTSPTLSEVKISYSTKSATVTNIVNGSIIPSDITNDVGAELDLVIDVTYPNDDPITSIDVYRADDSSCSVNLGLFSNGISVTDGHARIVFPDSAPSLNPGNTLDTDYYICVTEAGSSDFIGVSGAFQFKDVVLAKFEFEAGDASGGAYTLSDPLQIENATLGGGQSVIQYVDYSADNIANTITVENTQLTFDRDTRGQFEFSDNNIEIANNGSLRLTGFGSNVAFDRQRAYIFSRQLDELHCYEYIPSTDSYSECAGFPVTPGSNPTTVTRSAIMPNGDVILATDNDIICLDASNNYADCEGEGLTNGVIDWSTNSIVSLFSTPEGLLYSLNLSVQCFDSNNGYLPCDDGAGPINEVTGEVVGFQAQVKLH